MCQLGSKDFRAGVAQNGKACADKVALPLLVALRLRLGAFMKFVSIDLDHPLVCKAILWIFGAGRPNLVVQLEQEIDPVAVAHLMGPLTDVHSYVELRPYAQQHYPGAWPLSVEIDPNTDLFALTTVP
jgi:hypothetical protein